MADQITSCQSISIPASSEVKHFTALYDIPEVAADITGSGQHIKSEAARNGAALWYNGSQADTGQISYIGIFRDNLPKPNIYYFLDLNSPKAKTFFEKQIINGGKGFTSFLLSKKYTHPDGFAEKLRDKSYWTTIDRPDNKGQLSPYNFPFDVFPTEDSDFFGRGMLPEGAHSGYMSNINDGKLFGSTNQPATINPFGLMTYAEEKKYNWSRPIVFCINSVDVAKLNLQQSVIMSFQVIAKILPVFGAAAGVVADVLTKAMDTYILLSTKGINGDSAMTLVSALAQMADMIAPETVKGVRNYAEGNIGSLLKFGKDSVSGLFTTENPNANPIIFNDIAKLLNTSSTWLRSIYRDYSDDATGYAKIVASFSGDQFNKYKNILANVKNIVLIDHLNRMSKQISGSASKLEQDITTAPFLTEVPILRDIFVAGSANTILPTLPNADNIVRSIIGSHQAEIQAAGNQGKQMEAMMTTMTMGYTPPSQVFDRFAIEALSIEAIKHLEAGMKYVLPDSIPDEKKDCYLFELEKTGADIIPCRTGEIWDHAKRKCVMKNASILVTSDLFSKQNLIVAGIITAGIVARKYKKEIKNAI